MLSQIVNPTFPIPHFLEENSFPRRAWGLREHGLITQNGPVLDEQGMLGTSAHLPPGTWADSGEKLLPWGLGLQCRGQSIRRTAGRWQQWEGSGQLTQSSVRWADLRTPEGRLCVCAPLRKS